MRRFIVLASLACLLATLLPATVQAAAATRTHEHAVILECGVPTDDGFIYVFAVISDQFESFGDLAFWETGSEPFQDDPTIFGSSSDLTGDATGMTGSFSLISIDRSVDPPVEVAEGTADLEASFTPDGDAEAVSDRFRNGNRWESVTGTVQPLLAEGSLTMPAGIAGLEDLTGCFGAEQSLDFFSTNPAAYTDRFRSLVVSCGWEATDGSSVNLFINGDAFGAFGDVFIETPGPGFISGGGDAAVDATSASLGPVTLEAYDDDGNALSFVGSAAASAALTATGTRVRTVNDFTSGSEKIFADLFSVDGELSVTIGSDTSAYPMDDEHCYAADQRIIVHEVRPAGPKPKPLANDTPEGAARARLGHAIRIVTGGNALEPEAPCSTIYPGQTVEQDVPISYTAWWTVTGTGGQMSADTAGSDFDTVVGVYTMGAGGLEQVVCVDDILIGEDQFSLQARATWASTFGVTYYIQAGGYGGEAGRLQLIVQ